MIRARNFLMALAICMMIFICGAIVGGVNRSQAASKVVWEYKVISTSGRMNQQPLSPMLDQERGLNQLGADGWELVQFNHIEANEIEGLWIFRRAK